MSENNSGQNGVGTAAASADVDLTPDSDDTSLDTALAAAIRDSFEPPDATQRDEKDEPSSSGPDAATAHDDKPSETERNAPQSWTEAERANWAELSDTVQDTILRREREYQAGLRQDAALSKVLEPVAERIKGTDVHVDQYVARLLEAEQILTQRPADAIAYWIEYYGVKDQIENWLDGTPRRAAPAQASSGDRRIEELERQIAWDREVAKAEKQWSAFLTEHPDANDIKDVIAAKLNADPKLDYAGAYQAARATIDGAMSKRNKDAERDRLEGGQRAATKGKTLDLPRGRAASAPKPGSTGDLDEDIRAAMRSAGIR